MATLQTVCIFLLSGLLGQASASAFLRKDMSAMLADTHLHLLDELEGALGEAHRQATERRMIRLEEALRPTVAALPKSSDGKLGHMAVRYVLHRLFVEKHGWYVRGLAPNGETWNSSSPVAMLQDKAPQAIFEDRLGNHTFGLHELAVLAATLENLVHDETIQRLNSAYEAHGIADGGAYLTENRTEEIIDTYMMMYLMGSSNLNLSPDKLRKLINRAYPNWSEVAAFLREVHHEVLDRSDADSSALTFNDSMKVVEEIGERYGRWQDRECRDLKHDLMKIEIKGTGRVLLKDFYGSGNWQFSESVNYLRQLGALDESDPDRLKVLIPNYVNAPSNCVASSSFYSVCCIDECEALLGHLERALATPEPTPERIVEVISNLPSATVEAPREVSTELRGYLDEIARHHGNGGVPLHARLFAQVMHHAYPRECNFPHVTGTTSPKTMKEMVHGKQGTVASKEEVRQHIESVLPHKEEEVLPWVEEEELYVMRPPSSNTLAIGSHLRNLGRGIAFLAALLSVSSMVFRKFSSAKISLSTNPNKFYV